MSKYEIKTSDGVVHRIDATTHIIDSIGLTLIGDAGRVVAVFRNFEWMRIVSSVSESTAETVESVPSTTNSPELTGE